MKDGEIKSPEFLGRNDEGNNEYATPQYFFDYLDEIFNFTLDVCASDHNHKCEHFFYKERDGLSEPWEKERVWMNPPYGRGMWDWVKKAAITDFKIFNDRYETGMVVGLIPARTCTIAFHEYVVNQKDCFVTYIRGRIAFDHPIKGITREAPFSPLIVVWGLPYRRLPKSLSIKEMKLSANHT